jgi:hypothetical protein
VADLTAGDIIREKRDAIVRIAAKHGATQVRLIGSVARGDARPDSDVDLLVTWSEGTSLLNQAALMLECDRPMRSDADRVSDILEAIVKIEARITDSVDAFQRDEMLQVWAIHHRK